MTTLPVPVPPARTDPVPRAFLTTRSLEARGVGERARARCVRDGTLVRVRRGRYVPGTTHPHVLQAARWGARLDCVSLLQLLGVFVLAHGPLHVHVTHGSSRLPPRPREVTCHWRRSNAGETDLLADTIEALAQACRCQGPREAIATLDSAWHLGVVDEAGIAAVFALLPRRFRRLRGLLDPRCESGPESLMRLILRTLGCSFEVQVRITGVGRVDFVVDGWLIIECDSERYHSGWDAHKRDRRRDLAAAALGYTTVRPLAEDVLYRRDLITAQLRAIVETGPVARAAAANSSTTRARPRRAAV